MNIHDLLEKTFLAVLDRAGIDRNPENERLVSVTLLSLAIGWAREANGDRAAFLRLAEKTWDNHDIKDPTPEQILAHAGLLAEFCGTPALTVEEIQAAQTGRATKGGQA